MWGLIKLTYMHMIKPFLFLECIVDVVGDKRVHHVVLVVTVAIVCTINSFALALWDLLGLGDKLIEEPDCYGSVHLTAS